VILHSINCIEYALVFFALNRLGAICSPSSPMFNAHELGVQIDLSQVPNDCDLVLRISLEYCCSWQCLE
jgi:acyl-CoA synthetase (AMP-forming)/AMP-acid ligase II